MKSGHSIAKAGGQDAGFVKEAFAKIADRYVATNHVCSLGIDILWRRKVAKMVADWSPAQILDVATGTGDLAIELQKVCPGTQVVGTDFSPEMLQHASNRGVEETLVADALNLPFEDGNFDVVTVAFGLRNMADWEAGLREMGRVSRDGHLLVLDFSLPQNMLRGPYAFYLNKVLPKIAGLMTGEKQSYEYLAGTIERFPSGKEMISLWEKLGFEEVTWTPLSFGIAAIYTGRWRG